MMSVIANSLSLPSNSSISTESPRPQVVSRLRSSSTADITRPPRYSTLENALPPTVTLDAFATAINNSGANLDGAGRRNPPSYSSVFRSRTHHTHGSTSTRQDQNAASRLSASEHQVHKYYIRSGAKARPWATLRIFSHSSTGYNSVAQGQKIPRFSGNDVVQGCLELNLDTPQNINSINLSLRGRIITSSYEDGSCTFLDHPITSWTRTNGDPRSMSPSTEDNAMPKKFDGKLFGQYSWPFSFRFKDVSILGQKDQDGTQSSLPQAFFERGIQGNVQYELALRMTHGILRSDSKLQVNIVYVPDITPDPASDLRQLAYSENTHLVGPEADPEGWLTLPTASIRGRLFAERNVKLQCTLSLANPQSYTRGTIIPCHLSIESDDTQALDILANPKCIAVRLVRRVQYYDDGGKSLISSSSQQRPAFATPATGNTSGNGVHVNAVEVERAVWWVNPDAVQSHNEANATVKQIEGEIHLDKELQPSCGFPLFKVSYYVQLLPFESPVFRPSSSSLNNDADGSNDPRKEGAASQVLLSQPVTIATLHCGTGPVPIPFTKPKSRKERTNSKDYSSSTIPVMSFQRF